MVGGDVAWFRNVANDFLTVFRTDTTIPVEKP